MSDPRFPFALLAAKDGSGVAGIRNGGRVRERLPRGRGYPRVAVNVVDPTNAWRLAAIRGRVVEITTEGADDLIDQLAHKYLGVDSYPFRNPAETRVTLKIAPEHISEIGLEQTVG
ncbi:MAG: Flavin nucleotide binding protein [Thermomicrobiales bacterium]|nr:Flavin nucleotide binding protein [Thermomicrobiales bacterium]